MSEKQPGRAGGERPEEPSVPDEVWERFIRDSERDIRASAPKEPSARARMVTERLRQQEARGIEPEGWRTGPAWQEMRRAEDRTARRRRLWAIIGVPLAAAVALVAVRPSLLPGDLLGASSSGSGSSGAAADPLPAETAAPTTAPSAAPGTPTLDRPFAGSPAERYADGAAGIVVPEAKPVGPLGKEQVARALRQTKELLVGANIDRGTLLGGRPKSVLALLDPQQPKLLDDVNSWLRTPDAKHDPLSLFSRFDPREVRLVGDVVKTRGRMTFKAGTRASVVIHADYTFVYPLAQADPESTEVARTIVRRVLDIEVSDPAKYRVTPGRLAILSFDENLSNSACFVHDGFLHPRFDSAGPAASDEATPSGPAVDPYDRSRELRHSDAESCGAVSRT
ncbi:MULTISPECIES: hypothetical protein [unclassified Streptomyces]|uniref:hypothetical protein n=1 Tax=unclassified Streptomyces TaxID=2593676 RepID=UPI0011CDEC4A|nr:MULTISPECIES: hypothetical protein [unclassified Streptomyces]TXS73747.1 hypothetical protein EAO69_16370 [Streptomyces sp. me109]